MNKTIRYKTLLSKKQQHLLKVLLSSLTICLMISCSKDESPSGREDYIIVSDTEDKNNALTKLQLAVEGGKDTLYVFASSDFETFFQTNDQQEWITIESSEFIKNINATRLIINIQPLETNLKMRSGVLNLSNKSKYLGQFVKVNQGYTSRLSEDFQWLKFGNGSPFIENTDVAIDKWSTAQKAYKWTSTIPNDQEIAPLYGKNGYVKIGSSLSGADLITPIISGLEKDSTMLLSFNAISFTTINGEPDFNKLTINILNGGEFESGTTTMELQLNYYDHLSSLITSNMWNNSFYTFKINKPKLTPNTTTMQIQFVTGNNLHTSKNRIFLDNINLYSVSQIN